jgi:hypothetical protein
VLSIIFTKVKNWQIIVITGIHFIICLIGVKYHEIWQDEAHHILLGQKSNSLSELIFNCRYEGHPILWNVILYAITHLFTDYFYVQIVHVLLASGCVYLILKHAPFLITIKLLLVFGYFMMYEYAVISRNYSLSLLIILSLLIKLSQENKQIIGIILLLSLLCQTHLFSCFVAIGLMPFIYPIWIKSKRSYKGISFIIFFFALTLAIIQIIPPENHFWKQYNGDSFFSITRILKIVCVPLKGLLPLPNGFRQNYWNNNLLIDISKPLAACISVVLLILPIILFFKHKALLFLFCLVSFGVIIVMYASPLMLTTRNCGFLSIALFSVAWLYQTNYKKESILFYKKLAHYFFSSLLILQFISGIEIYRLDLVRTFSNATNTTNFLNTYTANKSIPILLTHHSSGPALTIQTTSPIFYLETNKYGSFCEWNATPFVLNDTSLLQRINEQLNLHKKCILITNQKGKISELQHLDATLKSKVIQSFEGATIVSGNYFINSIYR